MPICRRFDNNPLMTPEQVKPSRPDFFVTGVLNAGAFKFRGKYWWLVRVAEAPVQTDPAVLSVPYTDLSGGEPKMARAQLPPRRPGAGLQRHPDRLVQGQADQALDHQHSHLRLASSRDGKKWKIEDAPCLAPADKYEAFGVEDPRITRLGGKFLVTYSAISRHGVTSNLVITKDWKTFDRKGPLFVPDNKDICIFPEKINGWYVALHRPSVSMLGKPDIWIAFSRDLIHWGGHEAILYARDGMWDSARIGCGPAPIRTDKGWLEIYHGSDDTNYYLGAVLLDLHDPRKVLARSAQPILAPEAPYEKEGFFANVVFANGQITHDDGRILDLLRRRRPRDGRLRNDRPGTAEPTGRVAPSPLRERAGVRVFPLSRDALRRKRADVLFSIVGEIENNPLACFRRRK